MDLILISLGSNLGDRCEALKKAKILLEEDGVRIQRASSVYQTQAFGKTDQPDFLNQVVAVETKLSPEELLKKLLEIETLMGRVRTEHWGQRMIDLDLLLYRDEIRNTADLTLPHPEIPKRRFVLVPMVEIAGHEVHPVLKKSLETLLRECPDRLVVEAFLH